MLKLWTHPQTGEERLYIPTREIQAALDAAQVEDTPESFKAFIRESKEDGRPEVWVMAQDKDTPLRNVLAIKEYLGRSIDPEALWETLTAQARSQQPKDADGDEPPPPVASHEPHTNRRFREQKGLHHGADQTSHPVTVEVRNPKDRLGALLEDQGVTVIKADDPLADYRVVDTHGNELLINRLWFKTDQQEGPAIEEKLSTKALFPQLERMRFRALESNHWVVPVIILEGDWQHSAIRLAQLDGIDALMIGLQRLSVINTIGLDHSAHLVLKLALRFLEADQTLKRQHASKPKALIDQRLFVIEAFPGVSRVMAEALLQHFGTLSKVMTASESELAQVRGIGTKKAREIAQILGTQLFAG